MNKAYIVAFFVISIAMGFTMWAFSGASTPYVNISQARKSEVPVQVRGKILRDPQHAPYYDFKQNVLRFWIEDVNKEQIEVVYQNAKPDAFDQAPETAAHGIIRDNRLYSDQLIVKCPSKYESDGKAPYNKTAVSGGRS